jgi:hypothetical protein
LALTFIWHTDHYELRAGRWQIVWSQATAVRAVTAGEAS